ncbi:MAG: phage head closure protein, partial [Syntrophales bacterium]|nr:phage head closure protein [Syntrophales bacterium]
NTEATVWGKYMPLIGREYHAAQQTGGEVTGKVRMRFRRGMGPHKRLLFDGRVLDIEAVINVEERNEELILMIRETV